LLHRLHEVIPDRQKNLRRHSEKPCQAEPQPIHESAGSSRLPGNFLLIGARSSVRLQRRRRRSPGRPGSSTTSSTAAAPSTALSGTNVPVDAPLP
jgi:hypothetical protein